VAVNVKVGTGAGVSLAVGVAAVEGEGVGDGTAVSVFVGVAVGGRTPLRNSINSSAFLPSSIHPSEKSKRSPEVGGISSD
jgi:hypothetical protein